MVLICHCLDRERGCISPWSTVNLHLIKLGPGLLDQFPKLLKYDSAWPCLSVLGYHQASLTNLGPWPTQGSSHALFHLSRSGMIPQTVTFLFDDSIVFIESLISIVNCAWRIHQLRRHLLTGFSEVLIPSGGLPPFRAVPTAPPESSSQLQQTRYCCPGAPRKNPKPVTISTLHCPNSRW